MDLKELLGEELFQQVNEKLDEETELMVNDGSYIPRDKFNEEREKVKELNSELDTAKTQLEQTNEKLEDLKEVAESKDEVESKLSEIKSEYEEYKENEKKRINRMKLTNRLEKKLIEKENAHPKTVDLIVGEFDLDKMELTDEGEIVGYSEQVGKVKDKREPLFGVEKVKGDEPADGEDTSITKNPFKQGQISLSQQSDLIRNKPETAKKFIKAAGKDPAKYNL